MRKIYPRPILEINGIRAFFRACFFVFFPEKRAFCLAVPPKQMLYLTISNENIFFKTKGTRLGAAVAPNKGLE